MRIEKLTKEEVDAPLWRKLEAHLLTELQELRAMNDSHAAEFITAGIRGRIWQIKALLDLKPEEE